MVELLDVVVSNANDSYGQLKTFVIDRLEFDETTGALVLRVPTETIQLGAKVLLALL